MQDIQAPVANPDDHEWTQALFLFTLQHGSKVYVWANHLDAASEVLEDWASDNAPGMFTFFDQGDYLAACENDAERMLVHTVWAHEQFDDEAWLALSDRTTVDHSIVGHTTYWQFSSAAFVACDAWCVREIA